MASLRSAECMFGEWLPKEFVIAVKSLRLSVSVFAAQLVYIVSVLGYAESLKHCYSNCFPTATRVDDTPVYY